MTMQLKFCNGFIVWLNDIWYRLKRLFRTNNSLKVKNQGEFNDSFEEEDYLLSVSLKDESEKTDNSK